MAGCVTSILLHNINDKSWCHPYLGGFHHEVAKVKVGAAGNLQPPHLEHNMACRDSDKCRVDECIVVMADMVGSGAVS